MNKSKLFKTIFLIVDLFLISCAFFLAWKIRFSNNILYFNFISSVRDSQSINDYYGIFLISVSIWIILGFALDLFHVPRTKKRVDDTFWYYVFYPQLFLVLILFVGVIFLNYDEIPRVFLFLFIFFEFCFLTLSKQMRTKLFQYLKFSGFKINLGLISNDSDIESLKNWLANESIARFNLKNCSLNNIYINSIDESLDLINYLDHGDFLLLNQNHLNKKDIIKIKEIAENKGIHIYRLLSFKRYTFLKDRSIKGLYEIGSLKLILSRKLPIKNSLSIILKRIFDFLFSLLFISLIYWWIYLIVFFVVKFQSKGPILFKQARIGLDGKVFKCYKFRTMNIEPSNSETITKVGDSRIFSFGNFMRKTNIDEFPQFINVLKGDMSVVGPRPHMISEDNVLAEKIEKYRIRRWAKPGITGFAAIKGFRGGTESMDLMQKRINLDIRYIEKWSLWLDLKICYYTALETIFFKSRGH